MIEVLLTSSSAEWQLARFLITLIIGLIITRIVVMPLARLVISRRIEDVKTQASIENLVGLISALFILIIALQNSSYGNLVSLIGTIAAALTVAIGFGMRDEVASLVSGVFIQIDNPFVKGDYLKVNDTEGIVKDIKFRTTVLKAPSSEKVVVPNKILTSSNVKNYTQGKKTKTSLSVEIELSSLEKAISLMEKVLEKNDDVLESPKADLKAVNFNEDKVNLETHYWVSSPEKVVGVRSQIIREFSEKAVKRGIIPSKNKD